MRYHGDLWVNCPRMLLIPPKRCCVMNVRWRLERWLNLTAEYMLKTDDCLPIGRSKVWLPVAVVTDCYYGDHYSWCSERYCSIPSLRTACCATCKQPTSEFFLVTLTATSCDCRRTVVRAREITQKWILWPCYESAKITSFVSIRALQVFTVHRKHTVRPFLAVIFAKLIVFIYKITISLISFWIHFQVMFALS